MLQDATARVMRSEREVAMVREQLGDLEKEMFSLKREISDKNNKIRVSFMFINYIYFGYFTCLIIVIVL